MKNTRKSFILILATLAVCTGILTLGFIILIPAEIASPEKSVYENISGVGYTDYPSSCGLLFCDEEDRGVFLYLDFENILTQIYIFPEDAKEQTENLPYITHYTFAVNEEFAGKLCDRLGGVEMTDPKGVTEVYFSTSMDQIVAKELNYDQLLKISLAFFEKIAKIGLSSEDFMFIIESAETDISYTVCYDWISHMKQMMCNCIIN